MPMPPCVNLVYCTRTMTLSLRPPAFITAAGESRAIRPHENSAAPGRLLKRNAIHQHRQAPGTAGQFEGQRRALPCSAQIDASTVGGKDNAGRIGQLTDC